MRLAFVLLFFISLRSGAQNFVLTIETDDASQLKYKKEHRELKQVEKEIAKVMTTLYSEGYLSAYITERSANEEKSYVRIAKGNIYTAGKIKKGNAEEKMLSSIGFREKIYAGKILSNTMVSNLAQKIIGYYENNGYPFVKVKLDSLQIKNTEISASLNIEKNKLYKVDSLIIKGGAKIKKNYIENYIGIKEGDVYSEKLVSAIDNRMKELPFIETIKPVEIIFTKTQCFVYIYIKEKKASQFNGVLGILPDNNTGKITITGDARIRLKNTIHSGELFDLNWRKLNTDVQDMRINVNYPFLFKTAFGFDGLFKLYKKDTTFIELNEGVGLQYLLKNGNFLKVSFTHQSTSLITPSMFSTSTVLPEFADVNSSLYGIGTRMEKLDYRLNPRKGFVFETELRTGKKIIRKNAVLDQSIYENLNLKSVKYHLNLQAELFIPLVKRATLKIGTNNGWIENENLFLNELYRLGGIRNLRGFNEESIMASFFTVNTAEFRFLLEQNSNIYVFVDHCYYERKLMNSYFHDTPMSFGAGLSFQTKAGIFSMNYALGKEQGNPFILRGAKIHFGFINYF